VYLLSHLQLANVVDWGILPVFCLLHYAMEEQVDPFGHSQPYGMFHLVQHIHNPHHLLAHLLTKPDKIIVINILYIRNLSNNLIQTAII
jgi:hypothetical protein